MKQKNKHRSEQRPNILLLEKALSIKDRLFSLIALKRGAKRARKWFVIGLILLAVLWLAWEGVSYCIGQANSLAIRDVTYNSTYKMISKERAMGMLGLEGSVNLATFDTAGKEAELEAIPAIASAHIRKELPDTLHVEIEERIPIAYVELQDGTATGDRTKLFVDPNGVLFPVDEEFHSQFLGVPMWYLHADEVDKFAPGGRVKEDSCRPIRELVVATNRYETFEIPPIREIFRPKPWKIVLILENGTEVMMSVENISDQVDRLARILDHARATKRTVLRTNVIPRINPTVIYKD